MSLQQITGDEITQIHDGLIQVHGGLIGRRDPNMPSLIAYTVNNYASDLTEATAMLLTKLAKDHPFIDGNKRTAYFASKFLLNKNGADFYGLSIEDTVTEMNTLAASKTYDDALQFARDYCAKDIVLDGPVIKDYSTFYRLVLKSMGVGNSLSKM